MKFPIMTLLAIAPALWAQSGAGEWKTYGQNSLGWRYSDLAQIDTRSGARLAPQWIFQSGIAGGYETTPLVFDRQMFVAGPSNNSWSLDLVTGKPVWHSKKTPPGRLNLCCGEVNRGFATLGDKLFRVNIEAKLVALDVRSGITLWETPLAEYQRGYSSTNAPLVAKNLGITGIAGAEFGTRGFIDAYDANTGKLAWRFNTVPGEGEAGSDNLSCDSWKRGGGPTWITGNFYTERNPVYCGSGNPGPGMDGDVQQGHNQ